MIFGDNNNNHSDDYFDTTRMSFGDHIEDLRRHLIRAIAGFIVAVIIGFALSYYVLGFISRPIEIKLREFYDRRAKAVMAEIQKDPKYKEMLKPHIETKLMNVAPILAKLSDKFDAKKKVMMPIEFEVTPKIEDHPLVVKAIGMQNATLITLSIEEAIVVFIQVALVTGLVIGSPWIFYQVWAFIAAGLYPHEKKLVNLYMPFSALLFIIGVVFCYFIVIPKAIDALLLFNEWLNFAPQLRLSEWLGFAIWVPVIFGISFQTPIVMLGLDRIGIATVEQFKSFRKFAWFGMLIVAAVVTPTADPITFLYLAGPMCLFYEFGIFLCRMGPQRRLLDFDIPDSEEMIEV